jgi:hypothetical protein
MTLFLKRPIGTIGVMGGLPALLTDFAWSLIQMVQYNAEYLCGPGEVVHYVRAKASLHDFARNGLVESMLGDWLLQLDTDHVPEPDLAARMLRRMDEYGCDVLTALYHHKFPPYTPVIYHYDGNGRGMAPISAWDSRADGFQIGSAGAGALLVRKPVFDRIREELKEPPFERIHPFGEDHSFFVRLHKLGIKAYVATSIESPHLEIRPVTSKDFRQDWRRSVTKRTPMDAFAKE